MASNSRSGGAIAGAVIGTLAALAGGFAFGAAFLKQPPRNAEAASSQPKGPEAPEAEVRQLAPIVTNLGSPSEQFVRLEAAIVMEPGAKDSAALAAKVGDDLVAYLRTVSLGEIQGPTGFQYLREDLKRRAILLGGGKIRDLLLTGFVVE